VIDLAELSARVDRPDDDARRAAAERQGRLTKPTGALGRLEELSLWVAAVQGRAIPSAFSNVRVVVFAGDHGVARRGVSAYPPEVTGQMVLNFLAGGAGVNVLARAHGATVRVVDLSVDVDYATLGATVPPEVVAHRIRRGTDDIAVGPAMTLDEAEAAFAAGIAIADAEIDRGADLLIPGDMGIGNTTPTAVLVALLTGADVVDVVGRGTGIDDDHWMIKCAAVRDAARRGRPLLGEPLALLAEVGGPDLAAMTGFLVQAAARRTPVLLDGVVSGACALLAHRIAHHSKYWWLAGHRSTEPAHARALERLQLDPVLDLGLRLGEGTGALTALPLVQAAALTLAEMATFDEAGVSDREA
jgi:nicotinate-nucleotide--dimethylbenzimidazole phosphoribosyltransferase